VLWSPAAAALSPRVADRFGIRTTLPSEHGVLLTFDDGPHAAGTPAMLAALDRARAPAVFFVSGEQAARHPELVREIVGAGHEVGLHGHRHQTRRQWSRRLLTGDTARALDAVFDVAGVVPRLYRPPHGVFTVTGLRLIRGVGLEPLLWSRWGRDWRHGATSSAIARRATAGIRAGDVVLLHDADHYGAAGSWRRTAEAMPEIVERLAATGLAASSLRGERLALAL
jgi:peptidoglycan/xylan/chitin deacetylase (PgdA/CDA1 family)